MSEKELEVEEALESVALLQEGDADVNKALAAFYNGDLFVYNVEFDEDSMSVTYAWKSNLTPEVQEQSMMRIALSEDNYKILYLEFQDRLEWLITDATKKRRNA